ncbi:MAG: response regulator [Candidatus Scalindua rubra]|uniref:Response regulator n=1 Tax=Candidatus Scalindua rubra TaxID=1872076 RepID=A0A1E3XF84_9BACT|nr:MAG: response regulator [Candidatus Scalindua rubra]
MRNNTKVLVVDDNKDMIFALTNVLKPEGYKIATANNGLTALKLARKEHPDAVIMDIRMPEMDGIEAMRQMKEIETNLPIILVTAYGNIETAIQATKLGAYDYIVKPFDNEKIIVTLRNALTELGLKREVETLRADLEKSSPLSELMGSSDKMKRVYDQINSVSPTDFTVILYGETGSGKELVARAIHNQSLRSKGNFVGVDCGAIPETLIESELFGYERGAFTGANKRKEGYFEFASKGTLFMDEIGNLPRNMQSKLLRVLEENCIRRLGGKKSVKIDTRVIVASNEKLENLVDAGKFREDLYYRLNEFAIGIPPLRNRKEDIIYLSKRFLDITNLELKKNVNGFSASAIKCLHNYNWPGNVRELKNVIRRTVLQATDVIGSVNLPNKKSGFNTDPHDTQTRQSFKVEMDINKELSLKDIVKKCVIDIERQLIMNVLKRTGGNKSKAARQLKIDYTTMHLKVKEYCIKIDD